MEISDFINILAIILAPIVSVIIGQKLQNREKRRQDKMDIFKNLKEKIIWETIQNPYIPKGLLDSMSEQQQFKNEQIEIIKMIKEKMCFENGE